MKKMLAGITALFCLGASISSCNNSNESNDKKVDVSRDTSSGSPASAGSANSDTTVPNQQAGTIKDSAGQNYTFSSTGELQIVGDEYKYDIILPTDILFDFDKSVLRPEGNELLEKVKQHFKTHKTDQVHIWGHTDSKGSDRYNYLLSQKRAIAVCQWLNKEVGGFNMCIGRGETEPLVPNENPDGSDNPQNRQKNRRVTISVIKYPDANKMIEDAKKGKLE